MLALAVILGLSADWESSSLTQLSLQLHRTEDEPSPPAEELSPSFFARFDQSIGGFGIISGYFDQPLDVAVGDDEILYVLDYGNERIQSFDSNGEYILQFGESGSREGEFEDPVAIAVDHSGFVYVVDSGNHRIQKFDSSGKFVLEWGSLGSTEGLFNNPRDIAFDEDDKVYVADPGNDRIQIFTPGGNFVAEWDRFTIRGSADISFSTIVSLAFDDDRFGYILALSDEEKTIYQFELDGDYQKSTAINPEGDCFPVRIEVDNDDDYIFLADKEGHRILRYTKEGSYQGELSAGDRPFSNPGGLSIDKENRRFFVADTGNNIIQKFFMR